MYALNRAGRSLKYGARRSHCRAQWSGVRPLWPVRSGGKKSDMASSLITTRMRRTGPPARHIRYVRFPTLVSRLRFIGTKSQIATPPTSRYSLFRSASRKSAIHMWRWMPQLVRLKNYSNSRNATKPPASATHPGRRTFARRQGKHLE